MERAYSLLEIKSVDEEKRLITGIATTPSVDRVGDIVEPKGAQFQLPIPLLWQHDHSQPIGHVTSAKVTAAGILVTAQFAKIADVGPLKARLDEAWQSVKAGLVRGLSIGFRSIEHSWLDDGSGRRFIKWLWLELSAVTIPANADASIQTIRSLDSQALAASGHRGAGGAGRLSAVADGPRSDGKMNIQDRIRALKAKRATAAASAKAVMDEAFADGERALTEAERETYKHHAAEVDACDAQTSDLETLARMEAPTAKAVAGQSQAQAMAVRAGATFEAGKSQLAKGALFTRYAIALMNGKGSVSDALRFAQRWRDSSPEVIRAFEQKADPGTTTGVGFAAPLVVPQNLASEFVELLRAATILGRLSLRRVPFNVKIPVQTGGSLVNWVGQTAPKPVGELTFETLELGYSKIAGIVVISDELARLSNPAAEETIQRDLVSEISEFIDLQLLSQAVAATANNPASLTRGVLAIPASGTDAHALRCDINAALAAMLQAGISTSGAVFIMSEVMGATIGLMTNALGQPEFPSMGATGGSIAGIPVITSQNISSDTTGQDIVLLKQSEILLADDGAVSLDSSREATLAMDGGATAAYSLWQRNMIGIRAERWINYKPRRAGAVQIITGAAYTTCGT